jgi:hypothetical protein
MMMPSDAHQYYQQPQMHRGQSHHAHHELYHANSQTLGATQSAPAHWGYYGNPASSGYYQ